LIENGGVPELISISTDPEFSPIHNGFVGIEEIEGVIHPVMII
jgi:hypothetical protein